MILHSAAYRGHNCSLFRRYKVLKFKDLLSLECCIFANNCFNDDSFSLLSNHFKLTTSSHSLLLHKISLTNLKWPDCLIFIQLSCKQARDFIKPFVTLINLLYQLNSNSTVSTWNHFQTMFHFHNLLNIICHQKNKIKKSEIIQLFLMKNAFGFLQLARYTQLVNIAIYVMHI